MSMLRSLLPVIVFLGLAGCADLQDSEGDVSSHDYELRDGNPALGRVLLLNNGTSQAPYLSCGIPRRLVEFAKVLGINLIGEDARLPERERGMAELPYSYSLAQRPSGVEVVTTNCLVCHASKLGGELVIGLGNPNVDFTSSGSSAVVPIALDLLGIFLNRAERRELDRYRRLSDAQTLVPAPDTRGMNPADVLFGILAAHRDAETLRWLGKPKPDADLNVKPYYTDVPAWWNLHRRDSIFYSGFGQGSHARIMMSAALLCVEDAEEAAAIDSYFGHIEAFIRSLRPPRYTEVAKRPIDEPMASRGRALFVENCAGCHGDSEQGIPPIPAVPAAAVGTDPGYAWSASVQGGGAIGYYFDFFNTSWMGTYGDAGRLVRPEIPVYAPPPLDGVWATAPYFHNGSVPTLDAVLDPMLRPTIFRRSFDPDDYDFERLGYPYEEVAKKGTDISIYDATRDGYQNSGHTYAAGLTDDERRDLLEYLKTL